MLTLRDYQREALDALYAYWDEEHSGNGLIVLPTGAGKALVIAALIREVIEGYPGLRVAMVTHVKELIGQNAEELRGYWPAAPLGLYSAGLRRREARAQILFCGIQSVHKRIKEIGGVDLVLVDEAHLIPRSSNTAYGRFLDGLRELVPDMRVVGLTATPYRLDSGRLDEGEGALFDQVVYDANVGDLIRQDYLSQLINVATKTELKTDGIGKRGGDFIVSDLGAAVDQEHLVEAAVAEMVRAGAERRAWLAFCVHVAHAHHVAAAVRRAGVSCEVVTGETPAGERDRIIRDFKAGRIRCLSSVGVLTTGFNVPHVDMIALLRPTQSAGLYVQMVGRALRKAPGKDNALILDFARLIRTHGAIDRISVRKPKRGEGAGKAPHKVCKACGEENHAASAECAFCGAEFPPPERLMHDAVPDEGVQILSGKAPPAEWVRVNSWSFASHTAKREGAKPCLRINFRCGIRMYPVYACFEHAGIARVKAHAWWRLLALETFNEDGSVDVPGTVDEALTLARNGHLRKPHAICVRPNGKYFDVVNCQVQPVADEAEPVGAAA